MNVSEERLAFIFRVEDIVTCRPTAKERMRNTFSQRQILGNQLVTEHVSVDTSDQQTGFSRILTRLIRGSGCGNPSLQLGRVSNLRQ
jgi:hypothetical protein